MSMSLRRMLLVFAALGVVVFSPWAGSPSAVAQSLTGKIAYTCGGQICLFDLSTGADKQLTFGPGTSGVNPKLSPDGSTIAFASGGIYVMHVDGSNPTQLTSFGGRPSWFPDGLKIAFSSNPGIWVMNADGTGLKQLTTHGRWPAWSPDGSQIAFGSAKDNADGNQDIWLMYSDGSGARRVLARPGDDIDVVWSPSVRIAFAGFVDRTSDYEIFSFDPNALTLTRLTNSARQDFEPGWSPDAARIVFASSANPPESTS